MRWIFDSPNSNTYCDCNPRCDSNAHSDSNSHCDCNNHIYKHGDQIPYFDENHFADQSTRTDEHKDSDPKTCKHSHPHAYTHEGRRTGQTCSDQDPDADTTTVGCKVGSRLPLMLEKRTNTALRIKRSAVMR